MLQTYHIVPNASDTPQSAYFLDIPQSAECFRHTTECLMLQTHHIVINASGTPQSVEYFRHTTECLMLQTQSA